MKARIVIVGGGFGGVKCARTLVRGLGDEAEVVLFNRENHLAFSPLLAEVVGSSLNPLDTVVPLRQMLPEVRCRTEEVQTVDLQQSEVEYLTEDGHLGRMHYDHLVLACGNTTNLSLVPGMADHSFPLKTVGDATELRSHIMQRMEQAEVASEDARRKWLLAFLIVGGGYSGVEAAGEINDLLRSSARYFHNWSVRDVSVRLIHARDQILPEISPGLREFARKKMERAGVEILLNSRVASATPEGVSLLDGRFLSGGTIVCTIGNSETEVIAKLKVPKKQDRVITNPDLSIPGVSNAWAIGDCAWVINSLTGEPSPTTGQFAERQGRQCGQNLLRVMHQQPTRPFAFRQLGELCSIGGHSAVADLFGFHLSGFLAWFIWRGVYLFKLPSFGRRLQVGFDWAWLLVFPRDLAHVRTKQTDRVSHAHYAPGEFIFHRGEPPTNFYVLEHGEVEVVRSQNGADGEVIAVLGAGSFFGEKALLNKRPRVMSVRARTPVDVLVVGSNVFSQISETLTPLREALGRALNRRAMDVWQGQPEVYELLKRTRVKELMEPVPHPMLKKTNTMREAGSAFVQHSNEFFLISENGEQLDGILTITDFIRDRGQPTSGDTLVSELMTRQPVTVTADDDCSVAVGAMREYRLKTLPVLDSKQGGKLVGCIRIRRLMAYVFKELGPTRQVTKVVPG